MFPSNASLPANRSSAIYLDYAATTPLDPEVLETMLPFLHDRFGNPSSLHAWGRDARRALEQARATVAAYLEAEPGEIVFTSGATEADNLAILGVADALRTKGRHIITTVIEHAAVDAPCARLEALGWEVTRLPVDTEGFVSSDALKAAIRPDTALASIIHGNNEIGTIQSLETLGAVLREHGVAFHTDAVQTAGKIPLSLKALPVDYLSLSGHKLYGPKGVGALYIRRGATPPSPLSLGGGQESGFRSGTENLAGIVGLAKAMELRRERLLPDMHHLRALQEQFIVDVLSAVPDAELNGPRDVARRVPGNAHFSFPPGEGEALVLHLDLKGVATSSGSACHSAVIEPSRIVRALGKPDTIARATVRFSLGRTTTADELRRVTEILPGIVRRVGRKAAISG